jgi:hypothetical protein
MLNIVPVGVGSGVCTFTTASGSTFLEFDVPKVDYPHGTLEAVVGWTSWIYPANPLPLYVELQLWHDGGVPHMLQSSVWSFSPSQAVTANGGHAARDLYPVMLPDPGHMMHQADREGPGVRHVLPPGNGVMRTNRAA